VTITPTKLLKALDTINEAKRELGEGLTLKIEDDEELALEFNSAGDVVKLDDGRFKFFPSNKYAAAAMRRVPDAEVKVEPTGDPNCPWMVRFE
jgi:hypothetical protein